MSSPSQIHANQTNAQSSTGPRTEAGKSRSSQNALRHGLSTGQLIIPGENIEDYEALLNGLLSDHNPANHTETMLVHEMAKSYWLKDRAIRFQAIAFNITVPHLDKMAAPLDLSVLIRYQSANERAFYRALNTLRDLQKQRRSQQNGFVSQTHVKPNGFVSQPPANTPEPAVPAAPAQSIWKKYPPQSTK